MEVVVPPSLPRRTAVGGLVAFVALVALQHATRAGDLPPPRHFVSEYAVGDGGWVQRVAFFGWAASLAALAWIAPGRVTSLGLALAAKGTVVAGLFATQTVGGELPPGVERTTEGQLHDLGTLAILAGLLLASLAQARSHPKATAALAFTFFAIPGVLVAVGYDAPGWGQRGIIAVGLVAQALILRRALDLDRG